MKQEILKIATDMFLDFGFKSITMDDIANRMGISKKTIYTHYKNKNKLVEEATFGLFECISSGIDLICQEQCNPIEELYKIKSFVIENLKDEKSSPIYQLQKYYPRIHATLVKKQFEVMKDCVANNIRRGIEADCFRKDIDVEFITRLYFKGMTGIKDRETFSEEDYEMSYLLENYLDYHVRGIATDKGLKILIQTKTNNSNEK